MTLEQILEDLKTDRIKKCILDSDMYNEMDDQYALAYCIGNPKIDLLSVNAAPFYNERVESFELGMEASYAEALRILKICGKADSVPVYKGSTTRFTAQNGFMPINSPAANNIINTVKESNEIIYILAIGCCSNITSAILMDPCIKNNICVIWLGGHELDFENCDECNLSHDYIAGQLLLNSGVPLIMLPAWGNSPGTGGTRQIVIYHEDLNNIKGNGTAQKFFREEFPAEYVSGKNNNIPFLIWDKGMHRILWDIAAPAVISIPDAFDFSIIPAPIFTDNKVYAFDQTRHKIIYMKKLDKNAVTDDAWRSIGNI